MPKLLPAVACALLASCSAPKPSTPAPPDHVAAADPAPTPTTPGSAASGGFGAAAAANAFTFDVAARLAADEEGNFIASPLSAATALTMTWAGAANKTAAELGKALHLSGDAAPIHASFAKLQRQLTGASKVDLAIANRLFGAAGEPFQAPFIALTRERYGAELQPTDFVAEGGEAARATINRWVAKATEDKIPNLIPPNTLTPLTRLVLTNAVTFKGDWEQAFDPGDTLPAKFHVNEDKAVDARFMQHLKITAPHQHVDLGDTGGYAALTLPYKGKRFEMTMVLPDIGTSLTDALADVAKRDAAGAPVPRGTEDVRVLLPRFEMRFNADLVGLLKKLGVHDAFSGDADFSGINGKLDLFITAVIHEGWIAVDETGTEAAAATAVVTGRKGIPRVAWFRADRPFITLIRDTSTGAIVFVGRVSDPTAG